MSRRTSSIFSLGSLGLTFKLDESYYEGKNFFRIITVKLKYDRKSFNVYPVDMTDSELQQTLEDITESNLFLKLENDVFERHLIRQNPESLQGTLFT